MAMPANTYVCLDIPRPFADRVLEVRGRQHEVLRWSLPAETTVCGSNGVGPLASDEDPERVRTVLDRIAAETASIQVEFGDVRRFPASDVFYLSFRDEAPLRALHDRIARSGLRFASVPFPFEPHCTLRTAATISRQEADALLATRIPGAFVLDSLSLYELPQRSRPIMEFTVLLCLHHRARLVGTA